MPDPFLDPRAPGAPALVVVGCMNFGGRTPEPEAHAIVHRALERGLTAFDTANYYGSGASERILGPVLEGLPDVRIATKCGLMQVAGKPEGLRPERVLKAVDESLERLRRERVDLLYLHAPDRRTPIEETLGAVADLLRAGRIQHFGVSNYAAWEVLEILHLCDQKGLPRPRVSQVLLNLAIRQVEVEYLRFAAKYRLHTTVYNPLAGGLFARPIDRAAAPPARFEVQRYRDRYWSDRIFAFADALHALAAEAGTTSLHLAYAWLAAHGGVDSILVGPGTVAHLDAAMDACARPLPPGVAGKLAALQRDFDGTDARYAR